MIESLVAKKLKWHFLYMREEVVYLMDFDLSAAIVCSVLIGYHTHEHNDRENKNREDQPSWVSISRQAIRRACLGLLSITKIGEAIESLCTRGYLKKRSAGGGLRNEYLLLVDKLNADIESLPEKNPLGIPVEKCPARSAGPLSRGNPINIDEVGFIGEDPINIDRPPINIDKDPINIDITIRNKESFNDPKGISNTPIAPIEEKAERTDVYEPQVFNPKEMKIDIPLWVEHVEVKNVGDPTPLPLPPIVMGEPEYSDSMLEGIKRWAEENELFDVISVDNILDWLDTVFTTMPGTKHTPPSRKHQLAMVNRVAAVGKERVVSEIQQFFEGGGKSLDKLIASWKPMYSRSVETDAFSGARSLSSRGASSRFDRKAASGSFKAERYSAEKPQPPEEAMRWNQMVPSRKWELWGSVLDQALRERLADGDFVSRYDAILGKCAKIAETNHSCSGYVTFDWLVKEDNWMKLMNGACDWLLKSEKKGRSKEVDTSMDGIVMPEIRKEKK